MYSDTGMSLGFREWKVYLPLWNILLYPLQFIIGIKLTVFWVRCFIVLKRLEITNVNVNQKLVIPFSVINSCLIIKFLKLSLAVCSSYQENLYINNKLVLRKLVEPRKSPRDYSLNLKRCGVEILFAQRYGTISAWHFLLMNFGWTNQEIRFFDSLWNYNQIKKK